jgi:hypothetical protein
MYYLTGYSEVIKTLLVLIKSKIKDFHIKDEKDLKNGYISFLNAIQPEVWHPSIADECYLFDNAIISELVAHYVDDPSPLTDKAANIEVTHHRNVELALAEIEKGFVFLKQCDPLSYKTIKIFMNTIFYARSRVEGGGSVSSAIGVLWCANRKNWCIKDIVEFLLHEATHTFVFLDELRFGHYISLDELAKEENYALSAVLKIKRPIDKVFHSLIVAFEILSLREHWLGHPSLSKVHPSSSSIYENCFNTIQSVKAVIARKELFTDRAVDLLARVEHNLLEKFSDLKRLCA